MPEIFINYRSEDCKYAALAIEQELSRRFGSEQVFRASKSIRPGDDYRVRLSAASTSARALLVLIGPRWLDARDRDGNLLLANEDDWTRKEILNARRSGARIIPILCGRKLDRLPVGVLPEELRFLENLQSLVYDTGNADADLDRIAAELVDLVPGLDDRSASEPSTARDRNSFRGTNNGKLVQLGNISNGQLNLNDTTFHGSTGPVSTGGGHQYIVYPAGREDDRSGPHRNVDAERDRGEDR
ncbi:toll/interleukin-1 receptor domain-containing protein [Saccharopolyspora hirsuta]|uniref:TIR domain-containing protein n=1 Tax=Saccharopolyspora hirsuta TaxID=1837 RepID=A0A5M7BM93_SACHI|nr:toll/interleukin-1 receptor domain-containing protein [Saccharopolyspora hirsuta]KAA5830080.1 TIR domain-containing protein [Saccharopolyspora hirsuta]MBF6507478.1 toll/interleukin-1 receptor domain-containing protein [Nocardia farcinica]